MQPYVKYNSKYVSIHQMCTYIYLGLQDGLWTDVAGLNLVLFMHIFQRCI